MLFGDFGLQFHDRSHSSRRYASAAQCSAMRLPEAEEMQTKYNVSVQYNNILSVESKQEIPPSLPY